MSWYTDRECLERYDFSADILTDIELFAGWTEMISDEYYARNIIDASTKNSTSNYYSVSTASTSSSNAGYIYFTVNETGEHKIYYKNGSSSSSYATYISIYNLTKNTQIKTNSSYYSTSYTAVSFNANAGDVIYVKYYKSSSYTTFYMYIEGVSKPEGGHFTGFTPQNYGVTAGENITITATTNNGYTWLGWYNGDEKVSDELVYTFTMPSNSIQYKAKWAKLTLERNIENAGTISILSGKYSAGETVTITAETNSGFTWLGWYDGNMLLSNQASYSFEMPAINTTYTAKWTQYTLTINVTEGGNVYGLNSAVVSFDLNGGEGSIPNQSVDELHGLVYPNVIPERNGYVFSGWYADTACKNLYDFSQIVTEDITVYAGWQAMVSSSYYKREAIDIISNYNSSAYAYSISTANTSSSSYIYTYFTALTSGTYTLYYKNSSSTSSYGTYLYVYNVTQASVIKANSSITSTSYSTLNINANAGDIIYVRNYRYSNTATFSFYVVGGQHPVDGGIAKTDRTVYISSGEEITITATTNAGYTWLGWYNGETLLSNALSYTFDMPYNNITYTAKWIVCPITLSKNMTEAGSISEIPSITSVGEEMNITAITNPGYTWIGWYNGGTLLTNNQSYTFVMSSDSMTYTAKWMICPVVLEKNNSAAGNVSGVEGATAIGTETTIVAITNPGYTWIGWYNGGTLLTNNQSYTFVMSSDSVTYTAKWIKVDIEKNKVSAGSVTTLNGKYKPGDSITITANTYNGYIWVGWFAGENLLTAERTYSFEMPETDATYIAKWAQVSTVNSNTAAGTITSLNGSYVAGQEVSISSTKNLGYNWDGWYNGDTLISHEQTYLLTMPNVDTVLTAKWSLMEDVEAFIFSSTTTTLNITGVVDTTISVLNVPDYTTSISEGAFKGCSNLQSLTIPFVGNRANLTSASRVSVFGYIFGTSSYTGGVSTKQYYSSSTNGYATYYIPSSLKTVNVTGGDILYGAFYNCANLTNVSLPDLIDKINNYVFYGCAKLLTFPINDNVISIGAYAFYGCNTVSSINLSNIQSIADYSYANCTKITTISIPSITNNIGAKAFSGCSALTSIVVDSSNPNYSSQDGILYNKAKTSIICVPMALSGDVVIPNSINSIDDEIFMGCNKITGVSIPNSVVSIGARAFSGCSKLTEVTIPNTVTSIGLAAFASCNGLASISLPFVGDSLNGTRTHFGYIFGAASSSNNSTSVPSALKTVVVSMGTAVADNSFYACKYISSISLPSTITSIGYRAFGECSALSIINIPNLVSTIGNYAFEKCINLTEIDIPNNVTIIGDYAFSGCSKIASITLGDNVESLGTYCFANCTALVNITIPAKVTEIKDYVFSGCTKLSLINVSYNNTVYSSQSGILYNKTKSIIVYVPLAITGAVSIPNSVTSIEDGAFSGRNKVTTITLPSSITSMGTGVFYGCNALTSLTLPFLGASKNDTTNATLGYSFSSSFYIPSTLNTIVILGGTIIGDSAFDSVKASSITLPSTITSIGADAFRASGITSITIPANVRTIAEGAFNGCSKLPAINVASGNSYFVSQGGILYNKAKTKLLAVPQAISGSVVIPDSVTSIEGSFSDCTGITSLTIGSGITTVYYYSFAGCSNLETVTIGKNVTTLYASAFDRCPKLKSVTFANTSGWKVHTGNGEWSSWDVTSPTLNATNIKNSPSTVYGKN